MKFLFLRGFFFDKPKEKIVRNVSAHTKRAPLAIRTLSPRVVSWLLPKATIQKGGFATVFQRRPFCRTSSRSATGHRLSRSGGYARSLGSFTIIVDFKMCAGNFAQRTIFIFLFSFFHPYTQKTTTIKQTLVPTKKHKRKDHWKIKEFLPLVYVLSTKRLCGLS